MPAFVVPGMAFVVHPQRDPTTASVLPADPGECADAASVEAVPVTLEYAFTFEIRQGRASVREGAIAR